jgi:VWFA-related protein
MRALSGALFVLFYCFLSPGFAQTGTPVRATTPANTSASLERGASRRVTLDVVVTDKNGIPVFGLQQADFTLLDDKQPQAILSFEAHGGASTAQQMPVQVVLVVDAVNIGYTALGYERIELDKFLRQAEGKLPLPASLVILTEAGAEIQPVATPDGKVLADLLKSKDVGLRTIRRSQGFYGGVERAQISLDAMERLAAYEAKQSGRKLVIWISPGWPLLTGPHVTLTDKNHQALFDAIVRLSAELRDARITLYSVDPLMEDLGSPRTFYYESFLKGIKSASKTENGNVGLQVLAVQSGGVALFADNYISNSIGKCFDEAKAFYTLSFDSPPADGPNEYHNLQLKIDKPGLTARTRTGYYAQP